MRGPALGVVVRPARAWIRLRKAAPRWTASLFHHALPLTLLPAAAWPAGRRWASIEPAQGGSGFAADFFSTLVLVPASLLIVAAALFAFAPFFGARRSWDRAVAVAVYASTPVLLSGALLVVPVLVIASVAALMHGLVLCASGARILLDCRDRDCAAYIATVAVASGAGSMALGALCSAIGWI